ncbi:MAG: (d)CMP kinase [Thermodesulfobacterium sp.]|jgi:cytidylate kinase|nr:(d)CMP kinase [Thermodesulfobacterium sp.]
MENGAFIITIDGPAGSGKTTTARILAKRLGFDLLESGAFYRFVTYFLLKYSSEVSVSDFLLLSENKQRIILQNVFKHLEVKLNPEGTFLYLNGKLLKDELREPEVEEWVSRVSALPVVREMVNEYLRSLVKGRKVVAEGRDMGSVVFPKATLKFYLDADVEVRAKRRAKDLKGFDVLETKKMILRRDELDSKREVAPLSIPEGAIVIDNSNLSIEEVVKIMEEKAKEAQNIS